MYARIVTFRIDGPGHEAYHSHAVAIAEAFNQWKGLVAKIWLGDAAAGRYGGFYVFADAEAAEASRATAEFLSLQHLPVFVDLHIEEFDILDEPTAITAGALVSA